MGINATREALLQTFSQRCFWLFIALLVLVSTVSFVPGSYHGRQVLNGINLFLLISAVTAVGRSSLSFVIALLLATPALWFQYLGLWNESVNDLVWSYFFSAVLYLVTIVYLIRYVFQPRIMTQDKLFGSAAAFLLIGLLWAYIYAIIGFFDTQSFVIRGQPERLNLTDAIYLSITVLTSTGFGDVTPLTRQARGVCMLEQIAGVLFIAILIARLAGVYPPRESHTDNEQS